MRTSTANLLAAFAAATLLSACSNDAQPDSRGRVQSVPVIAEPLRFENAGLRFETVGTSRARLSAELYPATSGEVVAVKFMPGQFVRAGDVLVMLDAREQQLAVELARLKLADAERLYDRYARSADSGAVLPTALDAAKTSMQAARVELEQAELALSYRSIDAVFDGYVGATEVDPGDRVDPGTIVTTLDDRTSLLVSFEVPEAYIGEFQQGATIELETWSDTLPAVDGQIVDIGSRVDPVNRTFTARAVVDNRSDSLRPGMSFRISLDLAGARYASVTETAVLWGADGAYLWLLEDGVATRQPVEVVQRREGRVLIDGEFDASSVVVVEGTQRMREGVVTDFDSGKLAKSRNNGGGNASGAFSDND